MKFEQSFGHKEKIWKYNKQITKQLRNCFY